MAFRLSRTEPFDAALRRITKAQVAKAQRELACTPAECGEAVHSVRKRLKRLRALYRLCSEPLGARARDADRLARRAGRRLAEQRDARARVESLEHLWARLPLPMRNGASAELTERLAREADRVERSERAARDRQRAAANLGDLLDQVQRASSAPPDSFAALESGLRRDYRAARRALIRALAESSPEHLHELRQRANRHRHHVGLLVDAWPAVMQARLTEGELLNERLGTERDLGLLEQAMRTGRLEGIDPEGWEALAPDVHRERAQLRELGLASARRLFAEKPRAFTARMGTYWDA